MRPASSSRRPPRSRPSDSARRPYPWTMPRPGEPSLSLSEWLVLCLITEQATHGNAIAAQLGHDGPLGQVWHVHKAVVYRSIDRLQQAGLVIEAGGEAPTPGPGAAAPGG